MSRMSVLLTTEGTYPCRRGGVSRWCQALIDELPDTDFTVLAITADPYEPAPGALPDNVREVIAVPLWGIQDPAEHRHHETFPDYLRSRWSMTTDDVEQDYVPAFDHFLREVTSPSTPARRLGLTLLRLHQHFRKYDFVATQTHPAVWDTFVCVVETAWRQAYPQLPPPSVGEMVEASRLLHRLLLPLAAPLPRVDLVHSSAAASCGLPGVLAKLRWQTPYLLTEHGVYPREQSLTLADSVGSLFLRWFLLRLINAIADVNYAFADQISPVCEDNVRWERWRGVEPERIRVIYNGVDPLQFPPAAREDHARPTVVTFGPVLPLKGQLDLIEAAALVRRNVRDVEFRFEGPVLDDGFFQKCEERVRTLDLQNTVVFVDAAADSWPAMEQADVVAFPSVSEAFPYAVVEAMLTEAAIVATDVGGVREALGDAGVLVQPRNPVAMAEAIEALLQAPDRRSQLGEHARERAQHWFTDQRFADAYRSSYKLLAPPAAAPRVTEPLRRIEPEYDREIAIA